MEKSPTGTDDSRRIVFIGGNYSEFTLLCYNRKVDRGRQVFVQDVFDIRGYCLCEACVEVVIGETGLVDPEVIEVIQMYITMGHRGA